jgi:hypothetical protein
LVYCLNKHSSPAHRNVRNAKIKRFQELYNTDDWADQNYSEYLDWSKFAVCGGFETGEFEIRIWDANNFESYEFDVYAMMDIPGVGENMIKAVMTWVRSHIEIEVSESEKIRTGDLEKLLAWWGARGYLYYNSLKEKHPAITDKGREMLDVFYELRDKPVKFSDKPVPKELDPVWCEENLWEEIGKNFIDEVFEHGQVKTDKPIRVWKNYESKRFITGKETAWYSFSMTKDAYRGAFGDEYIGYELPRGFPYVDTMGLCDDGEVIINGALLDDSMVIQRGYSENHILKFSKWVNESKKKI